jgi:signal recognition particle GTPase
MSEVFEGKPSVIMIAGPNGAGKTTAGQQARHFSISRLFRGFY